MVPKSRLVDNGAMPRMLQWDVQREVAYLAAGFPLGLFWFVAFTTLLSLSLGLTPILIGVVLLAATLRMALAAGDIERRLIADWLAQPIAPAERPGRPGRQPGSGLGWIADSITSGAAWRALLFVGLRFWLGIGALVVLSVTLAPIVAAMAIVPIVLFTDVSMSGAARIVLTAIVALVLGPSLIRGYARLHAIIGHYLLGPSTALLAGRAERAEVSRDQSIDVATAERLRIERDLHDGAQARLSTVALDLGRARRKLRQGADPDEIAEVIDSAHADAKAAVVELRNLARGIHPAILTDRGLDAALSEVAGRSQVPLHLAVTLPSRPSPAVESAAYFAVCELVNNINRHSSAGNGWITVKGTGEQLVVEVIDDGVGGVELGLGSGVAGLYQRVGALGGTVEIESPLGEGTTVTIELPMRAGSPAADSATEPE